MNALPSSVRSAEVVRRAGSEPTSASVRAKALTAPLASRGKNASFCASVPNILSGCPTPID